MRQTKLLLWGGFGGLLLLLCLLGLSAISFLYKIERQQDTIRQNYAEREKMLERLRSNIYLSGTYIREYLLDPAEPSIEDHKRLYMQQRATLLRAVDDPFLKEIRPELLNYLTAMAVVFDWTPAERRLHGHEFAQREVLSRRMRLLSIADQIQETSERQDDANRATLMQRLSSFRWELVAILVCSLALGLILARTALLRILSLERESQMLSATLLTTEEEERRKISRELHDEVGQGLYATLLGIGNLRSSLKKNDLDESLEQLQRVEEMTGRSVTVVRNISLMLRPAMLDDLGLLPALKWLGRETFRMHAVQMDVETDQLAPEALESLGDEARTCIYRVVQEAVHNSVKHAQAQQIRLEISQFGPDRITVSVQDDGKGFDPRKEPGLGILGMRERVARLGGNLSIQSEPGRGTAIRFELPVTAQEIKPLRTA